MKKNKGFTLIEVMVSSIIFLIVMGTMYLLIMRTQTFHLTEGRKLDMNQASRAIELVLCDNIRSAGSVLSLLYTPSFLGGPSPFTGIYPLNNTNGSDGIILAAGDPKATTKTTTTFDPQGDITLFLDSVDDQDDPTITAWNQNDIGVIVRTSGYYIFRVNQPVVLGSAQLSIRATPVYYSGLLNTASAFSALQYDDLSEDANHLGIAGNDNTTPYQIGSPVIRLEYFNIFLVNEETDAHTGNIVRSLTLTTDTQGVGDILNSPATDSRLIPIVPFIEDIQFEYITKDNPPDLWSSIGTTIPPGGNNFSDPCPIGAPGAANCVPFINQFTNTNIASVSVYILLKTEEEKNKMSKSGLIYHKPIMGDAPAFTVPIGRFHYSYMKYETFVRNYNGVY